MWDKLQQTQTDNSQQDCSRQSVRPSADQTAHHTLLNETTADTSNMLEDKDDGGFSSWWKSTKHQYVPHIQQWYNARSLKSSLLYPVCPTEEKHAVSTRDHLHLWYHEWKRGLILNRDVIQQNILLCAAASWSAFNWWVLGHVGGSEDYRTCNISQISRLKMLRWVSDHYRHCGASCCTSVCSCLYCSSHVTHPCHTFLPSGRGWMHQQSNKGKLKGNTLQDEVRSLCRHHFTDTCHHPTWLHVPLHKSVLSSMKDYIVLEAKQDPC